MLQVCPVLLHTMRGWIFQTCVCATWVSGISHDAMRLSVHAFLFKSVDGRVGKILVARIRMLPHRNAHPMQFLDQLHRSGSRFFLPTSARQSSSLMRVVGSHGCTLCGWCWVIHFLACIWGRGPCVHVMYGSIHRQFRWSWIQVVFSRLSDGVQK